jgi:RNA polymerase sigma factor (TIGR02999 family)
MTEPLPLTNWLRAAAAGDADAGNRAYALLYDELRRMAARKLSEAGPPATLTPTALVNEVFIRLAGGSLAALSDRRHFFNLAARAMRQTLIDHARARLAEKRGGDLVRTQLDDDIPDQVLDPAQTLALEHAFAVLEQQDAELAETFGWHAFAGLSSQHIAELRGTTRRTVQRDIALARNYLTLALDGPA